MRSAGLAHEAKQGSPKRGHSHNTSNTQDDPVGGAQDDLAGLRGPFLNSAICILRRIRETHIQPAHTEHVVTVILHGQQRSALTGSLGGSLNASPLLLHAD